MNSNFEILCKYLADVLNKDKNAYVIFSDGLETYFGKDIRENCSEETKKRVINVGISEQNAVSLASGLALGGKTPYLVMFTSFMITRAAEQVKLDICYANANVKMIGINGGITGIMIAGYSHCSLEDLAILNTFPNIKIFNPAPNKKEFKKIMDYTQNHKGPCFVRLNYMFCPHISSEYDVKEGKISKVIDGKKAAIITTGCSLSLAFEYAVRMHEIEGYMPSIYSVHTIKPFDEETIFKIIDENIPIITIEEHSKGGLSSLVSMAIAKSGRGVKFLPVFVENEDYRVVMDNPDNIAKRFLKIDDLYNNFKQLKSGKKSGFFYKKEYSFNENRLSVKHKLFGVPVFKTEQRKKIKKGKLKNKYYILNLRIL